RGYPADGPWQPHNRSGRGSPMFEQGRRRRRRRVIAIVAVAVLIVAVAGAGVSYLLLLRTVGSPHETAASYLDDWQRGDYQGMNSVSVNQPPGGVAGPVTQAATQLGQRSIHLTLGQVTGTGSTAQASYTATAQLASG